MSVDLYRFYDADERLLYLGISLSAAHRASKHRLEKPWWADVAKMHVEHLDVDRQMALTIEREAIRNERPMHNVVHNGSTESNAQPVAPATNGHARQRLPVEYREVYAFALDDGTCPVGYVTEVWLPDDAYQDFQIEVALYSWHLGMFTAGEMTFGWKHVIKALKAEKWVSDGTRHRGVFYQKGATVYEMDLLGDFQTRVAGRS